MPILGYMVPIFGSFGAFGIYGHLGALVHEKLVFCGGSMVHGADFGFLPIFGAVPILRSSIPVVFLGVEVFDFYGAVWGFGVRTVVFIHHTDRHI